MAKYRYTIKSMEAGSAKYGPCEICNCPADTIHLQTEEKNASNAEWEFWTYLDCHKLFGHEECLLSVRRSDPL